MFLACADAVDSEPAACPERINLWRDNLDKTNWRSFRERVTWIPDKCQLFLVYRSSLESDGDMPQINFWDKVAAQ